jgi:hypothetical protein
VLKFVSDRVHDVYFCAICIEEVCTYQREVGWHCNYNACMQTFTSACILRDWGSRSIEGIIRITGRILTSPDVEETKGKSSISRYQTEKTNVNTSSRKSTAHRCPQRSDTTYFLLNFLHTTSSRQRNFSYQPYHKINELYAILKS